MRRQLTAASAKTQLLSRHWHPRPPMLRSMIPQRGLGVSRQRPHVLYLRISGCFLSLTHHLPRSCREPEPRIPRVELLHPRRHGPGDSLDLAGAREEARLQPQHSLPPLPVYLSADDKEAVRVSRARVPRGVAAPHGYLRRSLLDNLEVVGYLGRRFVLGVGKLGDRPQLVRRRGPLVLAGKIRPLEAVAYVNNRASVQSALSLARSPIHRSRNASQHRRQAGNSTHPSRSKLPCRTRRLGRPHAVAAPA